MQLLLENPEEFFVSAPVSMEAIQCGRGLKWTRISPWRKDMKRPQEMGSRPEAREESSSEAGTREAGPHYRERSVISSHPAPEWKTQGMLREYKGHWLWSLSQEMLQCMLFILSSACEIHCPREVDFRGLKNCTTANNTDSYAELRRSGLTRCGPCAK